MHTAVCDSAPSALQEPSAASAEQAIKARSNRERFPEVAALVDAFRRAGIKVKVTQVVDLTESPKSNLS